MSRIGFATISDISRRRGLAPMRTPRKGCPASSPLLLATSPRRPTLGHVDIADRETWQQRDGPAEDHRRSYIPVSTAPAPEIQRHLLRVVQLAQEPRCDFAHW